MISTDYEWWDSIYDDAKNIGMKIKEFDIGRGAYCKIKYVKSFESVLDKIIGEHGKDCETHKTAKAFKEQLGKLSLAGEFAYENARDELRDEFLPAIQEDYRIMLQHEYDYLTSKEAIIETIEANEYEFREDGTLD